MNNRRNFTGKSSFLKIIPFALFGKVDGITKKQIINWKNKKQGEVILKFTKNGIEYTIHRGIKPDIFSILQDGKEMAQSSNKKLFQTEFENIVLGIDFDTFMNIVYCDTNNMVSILNASKPVKRDYIEKLFNLFYFTQLKDVGNTKKRTIETVVKNIKTDIKLIDNNIMNLNNNIIKYEAGLLDAKDKHEIVYGKIESLNHEIPFDIDFNNNELIRFKDMQLEYEKNISKSNILLEKIKAKIFYLSKFKVSDGYSQDDIDKLNALISQITNTIAGLVNNITNYIMKIEHANIENTLNNKNKYTKEYNEERKCYQTNEGILKGIDVIIRQKEKELSGKPTEGICPICMQTVDFDHIKEEYTKILDGHREEYANLRLINDKNQKNIKTVKGFIDVSLEAEELYNTNKSSLRDLENEKNDLKHKLNVQKEKVISITKELEYQDKCKRYNKATLKLKEHRIKLIEDTKGFENFYPDIDRIENILKTYDNNMNTLGVLKEKLKGFGVSINSLNTYITNDRKSIKSEENERKSKEDSLLKYQNMLLYINEVISLCGDDKCKQYAISNFLPYLTDRINHYLNKSGVLFYIKLSGWLDLEILGPGIKNCSYTNLSGAERISLDRSFQMASVDIKKGQSSALIDVLILDEYLDSSLDDIGMVDAIELIKTKQKEDKLKVLVVSHRKELGSLDSLFDFRFQVSMDKYSTIKEI